VADSSIEWTDAVWNPVRGCSKVSAGCTNCYAMKQAHRFSGPGQPYEGLTHVVKGKGPQWTGAVRTVPEMLERPLRWRKPRRVFVNSMSDLFHPDVPDEFVDQVFAVMALTPQHTYQILTKRPERMAHYFLPIGQTNRSDWVWVQMASILNRHRLAYPEWPLPNVWLGTSVEDQAAADERIPHLLRCPAAVRFLSCEPLLGPVDLRKLTKGDYTAHPAGAEVYTLEGMYAIPDHDWDAPGRIDWVIPGGESGPGARPCDVEWIRGLVQQCRAAGVAPFVKQLGAEAYTSDGLGPQFLDLRDPKGGDPSEWPEDLRVREFPQLQEVTRG